MASEDGHGVRASINEHQTTKAAGRYFDTDAASVPEIDEDVDTHEDADNSDADGAGVCRPPAAEAEKQTCRPAHQGAPRQQAPLTRGGISTGRSNPGIARRDSGESSYWAQLDASAAAHGPQAAPLVPHMQPSSGSSGSTGRRHRNGLPARQPSGPLPGMPYMSDLVSRYPIRQAPASGPQISLVSGQLYVSGRLREAMSAKKTAGQAPSAAPQVHAGFPTPDMLVPTYAEQSLQPNNYMQQRRVEKEQRAFYTGHHQQQGISRPTQRPSDSAAPCPSPAQGAPVAGRVASAAPAGSTGRNGGANRGTPGNARQRDVREGVERWLETNNNSAEQDVGGGRSLPHPDSSSDPSLIYRQYGIFRTYGTQSQGLWPPMTMPTASRSGHRVAFDRKRTSSGAGGASPARLSSQPVAWTSPRQSAW